MRLSTGLLMDSVKPQIFPRSPLALIAPPKFEKLKPVKPIAAIVPDACVFWLPEDRRGKDRDRPIGPAPDPIEYPLKGRPEQLAIIRGGGPHGDN